MAGPILPRVPPRAAPSLTATTWAPVAYTTEVSGLTAGVTLMMPQVSLQSGFNTPYWVDEIRFTARTASYDPNSVILGDISAIIEFELQTGTHFFSQAALSSPSPVPMTLFCPTYSGKAQYENVIQNFTATSNQVYATRRWVLPKPLWMPAGDLVQAKVRRAASYGTGVPSITAQMTVIGRAVLPDTPPPTARCIPHIGHFTHPTGSTYSQANAQFKNPFTTPWYVQRIVMNTRDQTNSGTSVRTGYGFFEDPLGARSYAQVQISDSLGYKITGSSQGGYVPLADVASFSNDAAWTFGRPLPPGENYNVNFRIVAGSNDTTVFSPMISFVGYREELS
jgi:hypothetical protein